MREEKIDVFLNTFRLLLEGALACLNNGKAFNQKINEIEQCLLNASPSLVSQLARQSIDIDCEIDGEMFLENHISQF